LALEDCYIAAKSQEANAVVPTSLSSRPATVRIPSFGIDRQNRDERWNGSSVHRTASKTSHPK